MHMATHDAQMEKLAALLPTLTFRQQLNLLLQLGVPASRILGIERCIEHWGWRLLTERESLAFDGTVMWCTEGKHWVRC